MNIDYNAVIEILKSFLNNEKIEILGISVGKEIQVKDAIRNLLTAYEKEKEKNKELEKMIKKDKDALQFKVGDIVRLKYKSPCTFAIEVIDERELISKDKIKEILGIEEDINNEKLLSLLQTIVDENARLEDIEDRKVQIEYNNVFNKGVKSVEDKIKAKIEEVKDGTYDAKIVLESLLEKE